MTTLREPIKVGSLELKNRLYRAPVLEGAGSAKDPAAAYARHFVPNAEAGLGLVIQGNTVVVPEGRTSTGMSSIDDRGSMLALAPLPAAIHGAGGKIIIQLGHAGVFALDSWHRDFRPYRRTPPWAPSRLPRWLSPLHRPGGVHVPSTREVAELVARFGVVAAWAREAGYDGVQLAGANAKLLHYFLTPAINRRRDRYGGDVIGRTALIREIRAAIAREAGADYPVLLKYPALEWSPIGPSIDLAEGIEIAKLAELAGFDAVTPVHADVLPNTSIARGGFPADSFRRRGVIHKLRQASGSPLRDRLTRVGMWLSTRRYPFTPVWNRPIFSAVKESVSIPVFAVGGIRTPGEAASILAAGQADLIGIGRPFYAEPDLSRRFLSETEAAGFIAACESCNECIVPQMAGLPGLCYNPRLTKLRSRRAKREASA